MKKIIFKILLVFLMSLTHTSFAESNKNAYIIYENLFLPNQLDAIKSVQKKLDDKENEKNAMDFFNKINFNEVINNSKIEIIEIILRNLSNEEITYLANYLSQPEVKKYTLLALKHKNFEAAFSMLSDKEQKVVADKNPDLELSMTPKFQKIINETQSVTAYKTIDALEKIKNEVEKLGNIDDGCKKANNIELYNSAFLICGLGHKLNRPASSKIFAKMLWRGDYLEKDIPKAMHIYKDLLREKADPETAFYYGVINFNTEKSEGKKRIAACWIKSAASDNYEPAMEYYEDIKASYPDLSKKCKFLN